MSLVDAFAKEDRTEVKFSQFFALVKQAAQYETVMNAVNCDVPHRFIRETMTGKKEEVPEIPEKKEAVLGVAKVDFDVEEFRKTLQEATAEIKAKFGPEEDEAEQEQEAPVKEPPEITAESILAAAEETTLAAAEISHFPEHHSYLEPFFGSGGVFFNKPRSDIETINDLDGEVANLFRQIRNDPERLAREIYFTPYSREAYEMAYQKEPKKRP